MAQAFEDAAAGLLLRGIARAVEAAGLALLLCRSTATVSVRLVGALGVCSMPAEHPGVQAALERRLPLVIVDRAALPGHAYVGIDDAAARGGRRSTCCARPPAVRGGGRAGRASRSASPATAEALDAAGADWALPSCPRRWPPSRARPRSWPPPTARLRALDAARAAGLGVPEDLSVVGFDDVPAAASSLPPLTTIRQPLLEKGEIAGRLLIAAPTEHAAILPVELVVRGSTGSPRSG